MKKYIKKQKIIHAIQFIEENLKKINELCAGNILIFGKPVVVAKANILADDELTIWDKKTILRGDYIIFHEEHSKRFDVLSEEEFLKEYEEF